MIPRFTTPAYLVTAFNCPYCGAFAEQKWYDIGLVPARTPGTDRDFTDGMVPSLHLAACRQCMNYSIWINQTMVHPTSGSAPPPNPDLPDNMTPDYNEARSICVLSPRGAAALLRLAIEKLCKHLGENGKDLNADIASLVKKGLPATIQKSLDIVRVTGNEAVHPGELDLRDNADIATKLFSLVNLIAHNRITEPKEIEKLYEILPESKKKGIEERDRK